MIEIDMKENNLSVIRTEVSEIFWAEWVSTKIDNEICLLIWWYILHMLIMRHDSHLKNISRTKFMAKNMPRNCLSDIIEDMLYILWCAWKFWCNTRFDVLKIESHKKRTKKSPGRVTRGVELRENEKLPGHESEQVHHWWWENISHRDNYRIISRASMKS